MQILWNVDKHVGCQQFRILKDLSRVLHNTKIGADYNKISQYWKLNGRDYFIN